MSTRRGRTTQPNDEIYDTIVLAREIPIPPIPPSQALSQQNLESVVSQQPPIPAAAVASTPVPLRTEWIPVGQFIFNEVRVVEQPESRINEIRTQLPAPTDRRDWNEPSRSWIITEAVAAVEQPVKGMSGILGRSRPPGLPRYAIAQADDTENVEPAGAKKRKRWLKSATEQLGNRSCPLPRRKRVIEKDQWGGYSDWRAKEPGSLEVHGDVWEDLTAWRGQEWNRYRSGGDWAREDIGEQWDHRADFGGQWNHPDSFASKHDQDFRIPPVPRSPRRLFPLYFPPPPDTEMLEPFTGNSTSGIWETSKSVENFDTPYSPGQRDPPQFKAIDRFATRGLKNKDTTVFEASLNAAPPENTFTDENSYDNLNCLSLHDYTLAEESLSGSDSDIEDFGGFDELLALEKSFAVFPEEEEEESSDEEEYLQFGDPLVALERHFDTLAQEEKEEEEEEDGISADERLWEFDDPLLALERSFDSFAQGEDEEDEDEEGMSDDEEN